MRVSVALVLTLAACNQAPLSTENGDLAAPPADLSAPADLATAPACAGPPSVSAVLLPEGNGAWIGPQEFFACERVVLVGANLNCPGVTVTLHGQQDFSRPAAGPCTADAQCTSFDAGVTCETQTGDCVRKLVATATPLGPGAGADQLAIRLPPSPQQDYKVSVANPLGAVDSKVVVSIFGPDGLAACAPPAACAGAPSFSPGAFSPQLQTPCHDVMLRGPNLACSGASVSFGPVQAIVADAWMGPGYLGVRLPGGSDVDQPASALVTTPMGSATSPNQLRFASSGFDASVCF